MLGSYAYVMWVVDPQVLVVPSSCIDSVGSFDQVFISVANFGTRKIAL